MTGTPSPLPDVGSYVEPARLTALAAANLRQAGMRADEAMDMAGVLVFAQESGINSHGLTHLPAYISGLGSGALNPRPDFHFRQSHPGVAVLDADRAPGVLAGLVACDEAVRRAASSGISIVAVRNSAHFGAASAFVSRMVSRGMVALVLSNASPSVAPRGARSPLLGTNPIAAGFPRADGPPVIIDMATTAGARGRIRKAAAAGEAIPPDWALDADGHPTTDATAALKGTMQALGGEKGTGLGLIVELLCVALSGGATGRDTLPPQEPSARARAISHSFIAIDTKAFGGAVRVADKVAEISANIEMSEATDPARPPRMPGARAAENRDACATRGVLMTEALAEALTNAQERAKALKSQHLKPAERTVT